jgi:dephospho-CoA kinase
MKQINIIGIAGLPRSGKDSLAEVFMDNGYFGVSLGDIVRNTSRERHKDKTDPISVANMTETSNYLREKGGANFAMKQAKKLFNEATKTVAYKGLVVFSIRAVAEVDFILEHNGELIWVEAEDNIRYERYLSHLREGEEKINLQELKNQEALQWTPQKGTDKNIQMNVAYVKEHSTRIFENNGDDIKVFEKRAKNLLKLIT